MSTNKNSIREVSQRPQWLDEQLYPFQSLFVEVEGNRIHYIDEGSGPTLFFVHPGVGWSLMNAGTPAPTKCKTGEDQIGSRAKWRELCLRRSRCHVSLQDVIEHAAP